MHFYPHNIAAFNNSTRHLTRVERSVYRDSIELYYDTEQPLPGDDFCWLSRKLLCRTDEEKEALKVILGEFYSLEDGVYRHERCDIEIEKYRANNSAKARAGKASAEARRKKKEAKTKPKAEQDLTGVEHALNVSATNEQLNKNQEPITNNQNNKTLAQSPPSEPLTQPAAVDDKTTITTLPTNQFSTKGETFRVTDDMLPDWEAAYPAVDVLQELNKIKAWLQDNPTKRKTVRGMRKFIGSWLSRQQDRGLANAAHRPGGHSGQNRQSKSDAIREATFSNDW